MEEVTEGKTVTVTSKELQEIDKEARQRELAAYESDPSFQMPTIFSPNAKVNWPDRPDGQVSNIERKALNWFGDEIDFECFLCIGDGWKPLVRKLYDDLVACGWNRVLLQCKEKYGSLRFYVGEATDEQSALIQHTEETSTHVCDVCGEPGKLRVTHGWYATTCDEHAT